MTVITAAITDRQPTSQSTKCVWETLTETNNFGSTFDVRDLTDISVTVLGNFGSGGSLTVYGSNVDADVGTSPATGTTGWVPIVFAKNGNAATFTTAKGGGQLLDNYDYITVYVSAGTGVDLDVHLKASRKR